MNKQVSHIPSGYKPSPLGPIPEDWEVKRLGDLCENKGDYGLNAPATDYSVNLPTYLRITDIDDNGNFIHSAKKSVDNLSAKEYYLKDGDIVFARTGATVGKTYLYDVRDGQLVYAGFLIKFSPNPNKLIPYYLKAHTETKDYTNWVAITSQRSGQPGINAAEYCSLKLAIPPIEEQERICNVLQLWDTAIAKQTALIEKLTLRKRGLMQQLLTGKKRLKGFGGEWERIKAGEIFKSISVKGNGSEVLLSATQEHGVIPRDQLEGRVTMPTGDTNSFKLVEVGDFVISLRSFQGGLEYSEHRGIVSPAYTVLKPIIEIYKTFYRYYFKSAEFIGHLAIAVIGIRDGKQISYDDFCFVKIPYPNIEEQKAISTVFLRADKEIEIQKQKLAALQEQKKGLMQVLLTGKRRIL